MNLRTIGWPAAALSGAANLGMTLALIYLHSPWGKRMAEAGLLASTAWPFFQLWLIRKELSSPAEFPTLRSELTVLTPASGSDRRLAEPTPAPATVLVVEDEERVRTVVRMILEARGYRVVEAASGEEAQQVAAHHPAPIDLMIVDVLMTPLTGPELAERMARWRPEMSVLYVSGCPQQIIALPPALRGAWHYLEKPFNSHQLLATVRRILGA
jgi:CheY-like chemotaxis protein